MSTIKPWHAPDIRESIAGTPKQWLEPELARRIRDKRGSEGFSIEKELAEDIDAIANQGGGGGSYVGPLDLTTVTAATAYGQRALATAKLGSAIYSLRRDSDDTTQSFNSDVLTGDAPLASITAFLSGANGFGSLWADQSGNAWHGVQATTGNQPAWIASAVNGRPGFSFTGFGDFSSPETWLATEGNVTFPGGAMTIFAVMLTNNVEHVFFVAGSNTSDFAFPNGPDWDLSVAGFAGEGFIPSMFADSLNFDTFYQYAGPPRPGVGGAGVYYLIECAFDSAAGLVVVDGAVQALTGNDHPGVVGDISLPMGIGTGDPAHAANGDGNAYLSNGQMCELIIFPAVLSDADRVAIRQNIATYYGITIA